MKKYMLLFLFILVVGIAVPVSSTQYNPPWADNYDFNYPQLGLINPMDTRPAAYDAEYYQSLYQVGNLRYDGKAHTNYPAVVAWYYYQNDAIFSFHGHGVEGRLLFYYLNGLSYIAASVIGDRLPGYYYLEDFNNGEISDVLFALYATCGSAGTNSSYGNLMTVSRNKGVDNVLGFEGDLTNHKVIFWNNRFWWYANFISIGQAASEAEIDTFFLCPTYGESGGTDTWVIDGSSGTNLYPTRYGN